MNFEINQREVISGMDDYKSPDPQHVDLHATEVSVFDFVFRLAENIRLILIVTIAVMAIALAYILVNRTSGYTAVSSFYPEASHSETQSRIGGLAAQFGIQVGSSDPSESPEFYAMLVESPVILEALVQDTFPLPPDTDGETVSGTLLDLYEVESETVDGRVRAAVGRVRNSLRVEIRPTTGLIDVSITAPTRDLVVALNRRLIELVDEFNLEQRRSRAREERRFIDARLEEAAPALEEAENDLKRFLEGNRAYSYANSPELSFELARLERIVQRRQAVYSSLIQAREQAALEEVRNTPVITLLTPPESTVSRQNGQWRLILALSAGFGLIVGSGIALLRVQWIHERDREPGRAESLRRTVRKQLFLPE